MDDFGPQHPGDDSFTARMRFHQSWYRAKKLKVDYGTGPFRRSSTPHGNMLTEAGAKNGQNFLTPEIRNVYEERKKTGPGGVEAFRCEHNMLSSQPMCFNLFGPLVADRERASRLFGAQVREVDEILGGEIELRPQENPLKDGSAFDAFFEYVDLDGQRAFLGIETKLTDKFSSKRYEYEGHPGYGEFTRRADSAWTKETWERLPEPAYNQLWRNHLLTEATKRLPESPYGTRGMSILVHHPSDKFAAKVAEEYREFLSDPASFQVWRLDDLLATWSALELSPDETDWLEKFQDRYLRLELSESDWKEHQPPPSAGAEPSAADPEHFDLPEQWREFKKWIGQNYEGFVLNERSKIDFMLHRASCGTLLFGPNDSAVLKPKHCSTKKRVLIEWAEARSSVVPPNCENCAP